MSTKDGLSIRCQGGCGEDEVCFNPPAISIEILGTTFIINFCQCEPLDDELLGLSFESEERAMTPSSVVDGVRRWDPKEILERQVAADPSLDEAWLERHDRVLAIGSGEIVLHPDALWDEYVQETDSHLRSHLLPLLDPERIFEVANSETEDQMLALMELANHPSYENRITLEQYLSAPNPGVRLSAAYGLFGMGIGNASPEARLAIIDMGYNESEPYLRRQLRLLSLPLNP